MGSSDRTFGLVFTAFFAIVAVLPMLRDEPPRLWALAAAGVFLLLALAILFYGVVTPTGLLMRLFGKDPLRLRFDREAKSYWIAREPPGPAPESLKDQF